MSTETTFLLRYGELTLKSPPVRRRMAQRMLNNLREAFKSHGVQAKVQEGWARAYVITDAPDIAQKLLSQLFGLRSFSTVERFKYQDLPQILARAIDAFGPLIPGTSFAVRAKREKNLPFSTREIEHELGTRLKAMGGKVNLSTPELTCCVELREKDCFLFTDKESGPGGMPLGTEDRVISLISGGFDSPVATWHVMRRGVPCDFLFVALGGMTQLGTIYRHLEHLHNTWGFGTKPQLYVIPGAPVMEALRAHIPPKYWNVMLKRIFYRVGELLANKLSHMALVTGEVIGQVSSQTLSNLHAIEHGIQVPIFRPLLTTEKNEIIATSRRIGTHDISESVKEYCAITPQQPATRSRPAQILEMEDALGGLPWYESLWEQHERIDVAQIGPEQQLYLDRIIDHIPADAVWVDMREEDGPSLDQPALHIPLEQLIEDPSQLSPTKTYLLLCDVGMLSAEAAFMLQELGYQAYAFQGGISRLQRLHRPEAAHIRPSLPPPV